MNDERNEYWLLIICCLLLFLAGCVFGFIFTKDGQVGVVAFLSAISSLATVGAAAIAIVALQSWKFQFKFQKKYESILSFRAHLYGASNPCVYVAALTEYYAQYIKSNFKLELLDDERYPEASREAWYAHVSEMSKSWGMMNILISNDELSSFSYSPDDLANLARSVIKELIDFSYGEKPSVQALRAISNDGKDKIRAAYLEVENQSTVLLKNITS